MLVFGLALILHIVAPKLPNANVGISKPYDIRRPRPNNNATGLLVDASVYESSQ